MKEICKKEEEGIPVKRFTKLVAKIQAPFDRPFDRTKVRYIKYDGPIFSDKAQEFMEEIGKRIQEIFS